MSSEQLKTVCALSGLAFLLVFFIIAGAAAQGQKKITAEKERYEQFEGAVRAAAIRYREHGAACRGVGAVCAAKVDAEWRKAMALAKASYVDTPAAWAVATAEVKAADERMRKLMEAQR